MALVALAGPGANLLMALFWGLMIKLGVMLIGTSDWVAMPLVYMGAAGVLINLVLMTLNLFPLLPLDGGRVIASLLPPRLARGFSRLEPYGLIILLLLVFTGILARLLMPAIAISLAVIPGAGVVRELFPM
jgi:Zn-dependent protease